MQPFATFPGIKRYYVLLLSLNMFPRSILHRMTAILLPIFSNVAVPLSNISVYGHSSIDLMFGFFAFWMELLIYSYGVWIIGKCVILPMRLNTDVYRVFLGSWIKQNNGRVIFCEDVDPILDFPKIMSVV